MMEGVEMPIIQRQLSHSSLATTDRYLNAALPPPGLRPTSPHSLVATRSGGEETLPDRSSRPSPRLGRGLWLRGFAAGGVGVAEGAGPQVITVT